MMSSSQAAKEMKDLAIKAQVIIARSSAGEGSRRDRWGAFVRQVPSDGRLELALECVDAMSNNQRRQLLATLEHTSSS